MNDEKIVYKVYIVGIIVWITVITLQIISADKKIKVLSEKLEAKSLLVDTMTTNQYMMLLLYNRDHNPKEFLELNGRFGILWPTNK